MTDWNKFFHLSRSTLHFTLPPLSSRRGQPFLDASAILPIFPELPFFLSSKQECVKGEIVAELSSVGFQRRKEDKASAASGFFLVLFKQCPQLILHDKKINGGSMQ